MLKNEPSRAFYGLNHVEKANEADAIDSLLIVDSLFRSSNIAERRRCVAIVDRVKANNGNVKIFSSLHVSGEQLAQLTGVAAILRFPMPDIEDIEEESDDETNIFAPGVLAEGAEESVINEEMNDEDSLEGAVAATAAVNLKAEPKIQPVLQPQPQPQLQNPASKNKKSQLSSSTSKKKYTASKYDDYEDYYDYGDY